MSPTPEISILPALASDFPSIVDLQFQCFSHTVLIEIIAHPDTPETKAIVLEDRLATLKEDKGIKPVKAIMHVPDATGVPQEKLVGFCIFHLPVPSSETPGQWIVPTPLRKMFDGVPAEEPEPVEVLLESETPNDGIPVSTDTVTGSVAVEPSNAPHTDETVETIPMSSTNIGTLLPYRKRMLNEYVARQERFSSTYPPPLGYVRYLCVHPEYRRYGIGSKLMAWGCERFDEHGFDSYLEATAEGEPMYRKFGYEQFGEQSLKVHKSGQLVTETYPCMWRNAQGRK